MDTPVTNFTALLAELVRQQTRTNELLEKLVAARPAAEEEDEGALGIRRMRQAGASIEEINAVLIAAGKLKPKRQYRRRSA